MAQTAQTPASRKKKTRHRTVSIMANVPVIWAGLLIGVAYSYGKDSVDVLPAFTLAAFIFYTIVLIAWRILGFIKKFRFFKILARQLLFYEGLFLIFIYLLNIFVDETLFVYVSPF